MTDTADWRLPFDTALCTRADFQRAVAGLCEPFAVAGSFERQLEGLGQPCADYGPRVARLELVARLLWGLAPLTVGGGEYRGWPQIRAAITAGTDPGHPGYWGRPSDRDQRIVEAAGLGFGLALCPQELWEPLEARQRARLSRWLREAASRGTFNNNWLLFATVIGLGLGRVGEPLEPGVTEEAFRRVEAFYLGDGWYADGPPGAAVDHYGPWALHYYSLINAALDASDPPRSAAASDRARAFAPRYLDWFAADGAGLAFGRSLTYRFAQAALFGAMAFAGEPGPGWGVLRGAWARHLRWWARQPVRNGDGTLSIGYAYPNPQMSEVYNSAASPYWALKAFLPLALADSHPFWTHPEEQLRRAPGDVRVHPHAGMILSHDRAGHATALAAARGGGSIHRHGEAKYAKFAYSTAFGFSVPTSAVGLESAAVDAMLALSEDGRYWRARRENDRYSIEAEAEAGPVLCSVWHPWPDVEVETRLRFAGHWQIREHRITTARPLRTAEGAFCVPFDEEAITRQTGSGALAISLGLASGIRGLTGVRRAAVMRPDPNGHLLWPRTLLPVLRGPLAPGQHRIAAAIYADSTGDGAGFDQPHPAMPWDGPAQ
jgi:hypothetical protein